MQISVAILVGVNRIKSYIERIIKAFKTRVLSYSNSIFEAELCLVATLRSLNAIGLLDNASLVITPNAYTEGILYDVVPNTTLGDMTVVRATTATRVNSAGLIEVVPRNLFTNSNDFANASWLKQNTSITANSIVSPDGTQNASKFIPNSTNAFHGIYSGATNYYANNIFSVYAKKGEYNYLILQDQYSSAFYNIFNLDSGTIVSGTNGTITSVGNGWYRISVKFTAPAGLVYPTITIAPSTSASYLGDNTSGGYLYGAQIEQAITLTEYFPTTTRLNIPRIDYTNGSCPSLLVEPQRTNLGLRSQELDSALIWFPVAATVTANNATSPDGTVNADKIIATAVTSTHIILQQPAGSVIGTTSTVSIFAKASGLSNIQIVNNAGGLGFASYNLSTGTATLSSGVSASIQNYGNGWYRCIMTYIPTTTGNYNIQIRLADSSGNTTFLGNGVDGVSLWGFQIEAGSYPTSLIPTVASTVTRNADVISKTGISSLIGQTEGTLFLDVKALANDNTTRQISISDNSFNNYVRFNFTAATNFGNAALISTGTTQATNDFTLNQTNKNKIAIKYNTNLFEIYLNGVLIHQDLSVNTFSGTTLSSLQFSNPLGGNIWYGNLNSLQFYKTALTNAECITLTTL